MTTPTITKKRPGRPRNPDKPEQFSIRLPPHLKFGLELVARDRGVSLSQAVEYALYTLLRDYQIDGKDALSIASEDTAGDNLVEGFTEPMLLYAGPGKKKLTKKETAEAVGMLFQSLEIWRICRTPNRLRTPEEKFIIAAIQETARRGAVQGVNEFYVDAARAAFRMGMSIEKFVEADKLSRD